MPPSPLAYRGTAAAAAWLLCILLAWPGCHQVDIWALEPHSSAAEASPTTGPDGAAQPSDPPVADGGAGAGGSAGSGGSIPAGAGMSQGAATKEGTSGGSTPPATPASPRLHVTFEAAGNPPLNPERGFFKYLDPIGGDFAAVRAAGSTVAYAPFLLASYRNSSLPGSFLTAVGMAMNRARAQHIKLLVRFIYNDDGGADAPLASIQGHLQQLQPLLLAHQDVIVGLQAGLVGQWGEWHDSSYGLDTDVAHEQVLTALLAAAPPKLSVAVRTPRFKRKFAGGPLMSATAFTSSAVARIAHHNDCFLASDDDLGTYMEAGERAYAATDSAYVPMSGETCQLNPPMTDCGPAMTALQTYHWSLLNQDYHLGVVGAWAQQGCRTEIAERLGYRLSLSSLSMDGSGRAGAPLNLSLSVQNSGWAAPIQARPVVLVLLGAGGQRFEMPLLGQDVRRWQPSTTTQIDASPLVPAAVPSGSYRVALWLPDGASTLRGERDYAIRLANAKLAVVDEGLHILVDNFSIAP